MNWLKELEAYVPDGEQEKTDQRVILEFSRKNRETVLSRSNPLAHFTSSAFIVNQACDKVLMVFHKLRNTWAWPGGHADGNSDLLAAAENEIREETGLIRFSPVLTKIISLDILLMEGHTKKGVYINPHLHFSAAYLFEADDCIPLRHCPEENTAAEWIGIDQIQPGQFSQADVTLYQKILTRAEHIRSTPR